MTKGKQLESLGRGHTGAVYVKGTFRKGGVYTKGKMINKYCNRNRNAMELQLLKKFVSLLGIASFLDDQHL